MHKLTLTVIDSIEKAKDDFNITHANNKNFALHDLYNWSEILAFYDILEDENSRDTFAKVITMRVLCAMMPQDIVFKKYSPYPEQVWKDLTNQAQALPGVKEDYILDRIETWLLNGYEYGDCRAEKDDVVIDAGAFTGNTAIYFAQEVGEQGKVFALEPMPSTYALLKENTEHLSQIFAIPSGVFKKNTKTLVDAGVDAKLNISKAGASIYKDGTTSIDLRSIDSLVQEYKMCKIDFIKMDIEGAEMDALEGAQETIKRFKPKMALCLYHKPTDIYEIYKRVLAYNPNYKFYLKHNSNSTWETVLFCMPSSVPNKYLYEPNKYVEDLKIAHILHSIHKSAYSSLQQVTNNKNWIAGEKNRINGLLDNEIAKNAIITQANNNNKELQQQVEKINQLDTEISKLTSSLNAFNEQRNKDSLIIKKLNDKICKISNELDKAKLAKNKIEDLTKRIIATQIKQSSFQAIKNMLLQPYLKKKAFALCNTGKTYEAEAIAQNIISNNPYMAWAYYILGKVQWERGERQLALENLDRATTLEPNTKYFQTFKDSCLKKCQKINKVS